MKHGFVAAALFVACGGQSAPDCAIPDCAAGVYFEGVVVTESTSLHIAVAYNGLSDATDLDLDTSRPEWEEAARVDLASDLPVFVDVYDAASGFEARVRFELEARSASATDGDVVSVTITDRDTGEVLAERRETIQYPRLQAEGEGCEDEACKSVAHVALGG